MSNDINAKIGKSVREARKAKGMSQQQLADRIGLMRTSVANMEAGRQGFPFHTLAAVVKILDIDVAPFFAMVELPDLPPVPHNVVIRPVLEVSCLTCGTGTVLDVTADKVLAQKSREAHIEAMQEAERG